MKNMGKAYLHMAIALTIVYAILHKAINEKTMPLAHKDLLSKDGKE